MSKSKLLPLSAVVLSAIAALGASQASYAAPSQADRAFVVKAAQGGMAEVRAGQLASQNASSGEVRGFGQRMVSDHTMAGDRLKKIAWREGITLPNDVNPMQADSYARLSNLSGRRFDRTYMRTEVQDHNATIALFQQESQFGSDPALRRFAAATLPTLRMHKSMTVRISSELGVRHPFFAHRMHM